MITHFDYRFFRLRAVFVLAGMLALALAGPLAHAQSDTAMKNSSGPAGSPEGSTRSVSVGEIVQELVAHNRQRAAELKGYTDERHYAVKYKGFPVDLSASMVVDATYDAPSTKEFRIVSEKGSKLLLDKVLKKLLEAEQEGAQDPGKTALTPENYDFTLVGQDTVEGRPCYVLEVAPKQDSKLLYRGKIWVDEKDYAVVQIEAEPAKNPSFWIRKTLIHHVYGETGPFWLPASDVSQTDVRMGGTAVLTIDYGTYHTNKAGQ